MSAASALSFSSESTAPSEWSSTAFGAHIASNKTVAPMPATFSDLRKEHESQIKGGSVQSLTGLEESEVWYATPTSPGMESSTAEQDWSPSMALEAQASVGHPLHAFHHPMPCPFFPPFPAGMLPLPPFAPPMTLPPPPLYLHPQPPPGFIPQPIWAPFPAPFPPFALFPGSEPLPLPTCARGCSPGLDRPSVLVGPPGVALQPTSSSYPQTEIIRQTLPPASQGTEAMLSPDADGRPKDINRAPGFPVFGSYLAKRPMVSVSVSSQPHTETVVDEEMA